MATILLVSIPVMIICFAFNLVLRSPDFYKYNLSETQALNETGKVIVEDELVGLIDNFMNKKTDSFYLKEKVEYEPEDVFTKKDEQVMLKLRNILDVFFVIGVFMFIVSGTIYFLFIRWREKQLLKRSIKGSTVGLILLLIGNGLINMIPAFREKIWGNYFGRGFEDGDVLMIIFKKSFPLHSTVFVTLVSLLIMAVIIYATWQFVGSKKMFQRV